MNEHKSVVQLKKQHLQETSINHGVQGYLNNTTYNLRDICTTHKLETDLDLK